MQFKIIGAGITGSVIAYQLKKNGHEVTLYERDKLGGLCWDCVNYQKFTHIWHCSDDDIQRFVESLTTIRPYVHFVYSYSRGRYIQFPPEEMTKELFDRTMVGYSIKMWGKMPRKETIDRIKKTMGYYFNDKYQGILDATLLFKSLTKGIKIVKGNVKDRDLKGKIILTGAVDEYFNYCFGELPYVGMKSTHCQSEIRLPVGAIHYNDLEIPVIRAIDYDKFGFEGGYIGLEFPSKSEKHYPVINETSQKLYNKYAELAKSKGIILAGRLGLFKYLDIDTSIIEALKIVEELQ